MKPFLPSAFGSQCQGLTAFQSTKTLYLLASMTTVLEYVSFKLRVSVAACFSLEAMLLSDPGCSPGTPVCFSQEKSLSLQDCLCHSRTLCTSLLVTLGVPMSLSEIPLTPRALAQGGLNSCPPGRGGRGTAWGRRTFTLTKGLAEPVPTVLVGFRKALPAAWPPATRPRPIAPRQVWHPSLGANPLLCPS